jgi:hypothetical protein
MNGNFVSIFKITDPDPNLFTSIKTFLVVYSIEDRSGRRILLSQCKERTL